MQCKTVDRTRRKKVHLQLFPQRTSTSGQAAATGIQEVILNVWFWEIPSSRFSKFSATRRAR
jgi:hypothetical protein